MNSKLILCFALVLGGVLPGGYGIGQADITQGIKPEGRLQPPELDSIRMIDRKNGWAQSAPVVFRTNDWVFYGTAILRTTDGGKSWKSVLSAGPNDKLASCFYDSETAWVTAVFDYEETTNHVAILRTRDGGRSWISTVLRQSHAIMDFCLSFPDARTGWLMLIPDHGMNSSPGDLYRTDDGGANWRQVNSTEGNPYEGDPYTQAEFERRHPYLHPYPLCGGLIAFRNASTGWLWGSVVSTTPGFLSISRDGGLNWQVQTLPLPSLLHDGRMVPVGLPHFFPMDGKDGIVEAEFCPTDSRATNFCTVIYRTHDGGLNWQPTTAVKYRGVWDFISPRKGWIWSAEAHNTGSTAPVKGILYRTDDGGASWRPVKAEKSLEEYLTHGEDIVQLDFVDDKYGWVIARDGHNLTQLLQTIDGGKTWNIVQMKIQQ
jgi:photosystem II stability/assembly factor-like uncharacterized protein